MAASASTINSKNNRIGAIMLMIAAAMIGLAYASVPLYEIFCRVTGFGGTTQISIEAPQIGASSGGIIRNVAFNSHVTPDLNWTVAVPDAVELKSGEEITVIYRATNPMDKTIIGTSSFNVTPFKAGQYFMKIECFCFTEQVLAPGAVVDMPVTFYLDPEMDDDINTQSVPEITLSYTFFLVNTDENS
ncbi:MAG: cytochrome c oxidase assembly protein [Candidatus Puniceispirillales bacterium WSBS_2018_MAG_OTU23]